jgi:hypothetical protein
MMNIETVEDLKKAVRNGAYAWPGGYPCYFIAADGEALSFEAICDNIRQVMRETKHPEALQQWRVIAFEINWEDSALFCAHTYKRIESAYAED